jgi:hypothetical protein
VVRVLSVSSIRQAYPLTPITEHGVWSYELPAQDWRDGARWRKVSFTEEQLNDIRDGLSAEEYSVELIREWSEE